MNIDKKNTSLFIKKILLFTFGIFLLGVAGALNIRTQLGADPITVFYEGISESLKSNVGVTINIINFVITSIVFFIKRKYINIGTLIYVVTMGYFVNIGLWAYDFLNVPDVFLIKFLISLTGCFLAFIGIGIYISVDIGIDPWSAITLIISEKTNKSFGMIRFIQDILTLGIGVLFGGQIGIITLVCAVIGGPVIQKFMKIIDKIIHNMLKFQHKD